MYDLLYTIMLSGMHSEDEVRPRGRWWPGHKSQDLRSKVNGMARAHLPER